jgi:cytoskeletal protein CcmA (bactofilin family)
LENNMLGKSKGTAGNYDHASSAQQMPRSSVPSSAAPQVSSISAGLSISGKIVGDGAVTIFGRVEGELRASTVVIAEGAQMEGEIVAEELTIGGQVKGTLHANRVKLNSTAVVEGDICHRTLAIEENARFEGTSRSENKIDTPSRVQTNRPHPQTASIDGNPKSNGSSQGPSNGGDWQAASGEFSKR